MSRVKIMDSIFIIAFLLRIYSDNVLQSKQIKSIFTLSLYLG